MMKKPLLCSVLILALFALLAGCEGNVPPVADTAAPLASESNSDATSDADDLVPVYPDQIAGGTYSIEVTSSSSMFRVVDAELTVSGATMTAVLTLSGTGYGKLYMGTGDEALAANDDTFIPFIENSDGAYTYLVPVEALDKDIDIAAWSIRKEKWYDRVCVFKSSMIPAAAITQH